MRIRKGASGTPFFFQRKHKPNNHKHTKTVCDKRQPIGIPPLEGGIILEVCKKKRKSISENNPAAISAEVTAAYPVVSVSAGPFCRCAGMAGSMRAANRRYYGEICPLTARKNLCPCGEDSRLIAVNRRCCGESFPPHARANLCRRGDEG
jgi:hypothetical protein